MFFFFYLAHVTCFSQCSMPLNVYFFSFLFFCVCVFVLSMLYDRLNVFFFLVFFVTVVLFFQCSMPLYLYCFLFFCVCGRFCHCSMPLFYIFIFCACGSILPKFYAFLFIFFVCVSVLKLFYASLLILCLYIRAYLLVLPMLNYSLDVGFFCNGGFNYQKFSAPFKWVFLFFCERGLV